MVTWFLASIGGFDVRPFTFAPWQNVVGRNDSEGDRRNSNAPSATLTMTFVVSASDLPDGQNCATSIVPCICSSPTAMDHLVSAAAAPRFQPEFDGRQKR